MPSLQATADDALPRRGARDAPLNPETNGGQGEPEEQLQTASAAASEARALLACSAASWPLSLRRLSFATELLPLPDDVAEWMRSGGRVWLPEGSAAMPVRAEMDEFDIAEERERFGGGGDDEAEKKCGGDADAADAAAAADDNSDSSSSASSSEASSAPPEGLAEFSRSIDAAIARLGGRALPKLDWSAPLDAAWLRPGGSLECSNADEVLLLLKSSDRISHDLEELSRVAEAITKGDEDPSSSNSAENLLLLKNISAPTLALRRWHPLRPGAEFRAFFEAGCRLVALCQRDVTQHFEGLGRDRRGVLRSVARFARRELAPALLAAARPASASASPSVPSPPSVLASSRFVADLYVHASGKVRLVDLAVPGGTTSPLLFSSWEEVFPELGRGGEENGSGEREEREEEIGNGDDDDDASDAELSLPPSSSDDDDDEEESSSDEEGEGSEGRAEQQQTLPTARVRFRVVAARGGIAPGRSLYGAPHDFADGDCVEALVERLKATEM